MAGRIQRLFIFEKPGPEVVRYIINQEIHHKKITILDEYRKFLNLFEIDWDERYIFKELE